MSSTNEAETGGDFLLYEKDVENRIAYLTFNRPKVLNGPTVAMRQQYAELLWEANVDNDVKVLVIRGAGENLGSGADLEEHFKNWANDPLEDWGLGDRSNVTAPPVGSYRAFVGPLYSTRTAGCRSLQEFRKVSIVEVKGYCYGWHFYQAGDADIVVASDDALFGHSAFRYAGWGPRMWTWIETIGLRKFQEMVFTGRPFTAQEMAECNFVNSLVPRDKLEDETRKYALACARNAPTDRIVMQKMFFEIYKQNRGEYMGSLISAVLESLGSMVQADDDEFVLGQDVLDSGLAAAVRRAEQRFPPEWRMSKSGRSRPE